ncbi:hypothetical protein RF11_04788 [Thelohanellus kitauei]|uniref:Uncharacterized protein n=1 Tax=Thelohanellus kitauei TaxID=669202 RepID=A0A0C2ILA8_THEKT|nr:hypothetical protein RF11_04788 [Thelohanellus kitauei]
MDQGTIEDLYRNCKKLMLCCRLEVMADQKEFIFTLLYALHLGRHGLLQFIKAETLIVEHDAERIEISGTLLTEEKIHDNGDIDLLVSLEVDVLFLTGRSLKIKKPAE